MMTLRFGGSCKPIWFLGGTVAVMLVGGIIFNAYLALTAERTLHAYLLVLDVATEYSVLHPGKWPRSWGDLEDVHPSRSHGGWRWPDDSKSIAARVRVRFEMSYNEVARMEPENFTAICPIGPSFAIDVHAVQSLVRKMHQSDGNKDEEE